MRGFGDEGGGGLAVEMGLVGWVRGIGFGHGLGSEGMGYWRRIKVDRYRYCQSELLYCHVLRLQAITPSGQESCMSRFGSYL